MERIEAESMNPAHLRDQAWMSDVITSAQRRQYWGDIILRFENGILMSADKRETLKVPRLQK